MNQELYLALIVQHSLCGEVGQEPLRPVQRMPPQTDLKTDEADRSKSITRQVEDRQLLNIRDGTVIRRIWPDIQVSDTLF